MRRIYFPAVSVALLLAVPLFEPAPSSAFDAKAGPLAEVAPGQTVSTPSCRVDANLVHVLSVGGAPDSTPDGACLLRSARSGNFIAARMLADAYARALTEGTPESTGDLFGRQIMWRRAAAVSGRVEDEILLAQAFDFDPRVRMPDQALAYYIRAAHHGNASAGDAVAQAWAQGRILPDQIGDFRLWIDAQAPTHPAFRRAALRLDQEANSSD